MNATVSERVSDWLDERDARAELKRLGESRVEDIVNGHFPFERRAAILLRLLPATSFELYELLHAYWPSFFDGLTDAAVAKRMSRDMKRLRVTRDRHTTVWMLPTEAQR